MNTDELRDLLEDHSRLLAAGGFRVEPAVVEPPATEAELAELEGQLGIALPGSFRRVLLEVSRHVEWRWFVDESVPVLPLPFDEIWCGEVRWSAGLLVALQRDHAGWVESCFPDPDDGYDAVWHAKLPFQPVGNGDFLAVDLEPAHEGRVVFLSHDDGEGHGYVLADSPGDLIERWAPLAFPGAEDSGWLPFVPWDEGPIDPTCPNARSWVHLLGLRDDPSHVAPVIPSRELTDELLATYHSSPDSNEGRHAARRALKRMTPDRLAEVVGFVRTEDAAIQELAATILGDWQVKSAIPDLVEVARSGTHNGRLAALRALDKIPGPEADAAFGSLREVLDENSHPRLRPDADAGSDPDNG